MANDFEILNGSGPEEKQPKQRPTIIETEHLRWLPTDEHRLRVATEADEGKDARVSIQERTRVNGLAWNPAG